MLFGNGSCQNRKAQSVFLYPIGYPSSEANALQQLKEYPLPRYMPGNHLQRLFNWIVPGYLAAEVSLKDIWMNQYYIQEELAVHWNFGIVISNAGVIGQGATPDIEVANAYPNIPLDVITFTSSPLVERINKTTVQRVKIDSSYFITYNDNGKHTVIKFNFPDSLIRSTGLVQKSNLMNLLSQLTRPIDRINENGEEDPQAYLIKYIQNDSDMVRMKRSMGFKSWDDFASTRKLQMRNAYSSAFMNELPELQNAFFSFYTVEGGPIDRFKWSIMKKCMTPINGIYYSTPDFYPRWPSNWKDWQGAWHGWKWISIGRATEINDGDYLFSPYVAAGWSQKNEDNITPGQWLGLLKCLSVVGAEFYYVGYFNLKAPFAKPGDYVWQAAMPAYAQAITSRFEDVLKDGNVLFDENNKPVISYTTSDVHDLITARKQNGKEKYVICGTYQPFSNDSNEIPEKHNVSVTINGKNLSFEIRRQGSVYIYERTADNRTIFYQLDRWHENKHPERWSKDFYFEAEVADSGISSNDIYTTNSTTEGDYTNFTSYVLLKDKECLYHFEERDSIIQDHFLWVRCKGEGTLSAKIKNGNKGKMIDQNKVISSNNWQWVKIALPKAFNYYGVNSLKINSTKGEIDLDKLLISASENQPSIDL